ncbi:MAG TPA: hypothetical protein VNN13_09725 [Methylomirabilota bacterium]|nr:hypothetical protein [Methylomirabilota bacterium]
MIERENGAIADPQIPEGKPHERPFENITWPVKGVVVNVLPPDSEDNGQGQLLCDVRLVDDGYTLFHVAVLSPAFHQDTDPERPMARQAVPSRSRNIYDGESFSPQVGDIVLVQFIGPPGPNREAVITGFFGVSMQSLPHGRRSGKDNIFPREAQAVTVFDQDGHPIEEFRSRLHATESEQPRYTRIQNGSAFEIDNRGNINLQSTINREPIQKERYSHYSFTSLKPTDPTPPPEGNIMLSTRGARRGNIGLVTGKIETTRLTRPLIAMEAGVERVHEIVIRDEVDEANEEGNILLQTTGAKIGDILAAVRAKENNQKIGNGFVRLGTADAVHPAVLGDYLLDWIVRQVLTHRHTGVERGDGMTDPPIMTEPDILSDLVGVARESDLDDNFAADLLSSSVNSSNALKNAGVVASSSALDQMALAIMQMEGYFPGSRSQRNNNPGNLVYKRQPGAIGKDGDGFAIFDTFENGWEALRQQLKSAASGTSKIYSPNMTLVEFFSKYDPTGNPTRYAEHVAKGLGVSPTTTIAEALG